MSTQLVQWKPITALGFVDKKSCDLDKNQRLCLKIALHAKPLRPRHIPSGPLRFYLWCFVKSPRFEFTIFAAVILHTLTLAQNCRPETGYQTFIIDTMHWMFMTIFTIESLLKLIAMRQTNYFADNWNVFDFAILFGSYINIVREMISPGNSVVNIAFLRLLRVFRLRRLLSQSSQKMLMSTFIWWMEILPHFVLLIELVFFIYVVVGMQVLDFTAPDDTQTGHVQSFREVAFALFKTATGEPWQQVTLWLGYSVFMFLSFLITHMSVWQYLDRFDYLARDWSILSPHHLETFFRLWTEYDPEGVGRIEHQKVLALLIRLSPPLGFGALCPHRLVCKRLMAMNMPMSADGTVCFNATLVALVRTCLCIHTEGSIQDSCHRMRKVIETLWKQIPDNVLDQIIAPSGHETVAKFYAASLIQYYWRQRDTRRKSNKENTEHSLENNNALCICETEFAIEDNLSLPPVDSPDEGSDTDWSVDFEVP